MLGNLIGGFITILIGVALMPVLANAIYGASHNSTGGNKGFNVTGATATILNLTNIFYALGIMSAGVALTVNGLRNAGLV